MSDRIASLAAVLVKHCGKRAGVKAGPILLDLMRDYYALVHVGELTDDERRAGLLVRIAAELEREAAVGAARLSAGATYASEDRAAMTERYPRR